jgi:hypothetical protein
MERLAFQNMTTKNRTNFKNGIDLCGYSQPIGEVTTKSKINTRTDNYFLERQSNNSGDYNNFVSSLNSNIIEDQFRTNVNNDHFSNKHVPEDTLQHIYHPALMGEKEAVTDSYDRCGLGTRDRQANTMAKNKNSKYPQEYNQTEPLKMNVSSQIDTQFGCLIDQDMEKQISILTKKAQMSTQTSNTHPSGNGQNVSQGYNPQADYLNQQLTQYAQQVPSQRTLDCSRMLDFQRPSSSNIKTPDVCTGIPNVCTRISPLQQQVQQCSKPQIQPQQRSKNNNKVKKVQFKQSK